MNRNRINRISIFLVLVIFTGAWHPAVAGSLQARTSTSRVELGGTFTLTLSVEDISQSTAPDLTPLQKNFDILSTGRNSQTSIVNGKRTDTFSWVITLAAKETGSLTIPAITAGNASSEPTLIEVVSQSASPTGSVKNEELDIDVSVEPGSYYVHQEIPVTVRITTNLPVREAQLQEPSGADFVFTQSGNDSINTVDRNGQSATVIERRYLLKPSKSGQLTIPPVTFKASVDDPSATQSPFSGTGFAGMFGRSAFSSSVFNNMFNPGKQIVVRSDPVTIDVMAKPTADGSWFLPAKNVQLKSSWVPSTPTFRVGESVTRKIQLLALGASTEQLPDIKPENTDAARVYVDRSIDKSVDTPEGTAAMREFVTSVVPTKAGNTTLPAIKITWWDINAKIERIATLDAETISVQASPGGDINASNLIGSHEVSTDESIAASAEDQTKTISSWFSNRMLTIVTIIVALVTASFIFLLMLIRKRTPTHAAKEQKPLKKSQFSILGERNNELSLAESKLVRACKTNDAQIAYTALTDWVDAVRHPVAGDLNQLSSVSSTLAEESRNLENHLFGATEKHPWNGSALLEAFITAKPFFLKSRSKKTAPAELSLLYPVTTNI